MLCYVTNLTVSRDIDLFRKSWYRHFESRLNVGEDLMVIFRRHEAYCQTLGSESASSAHLFSVVLGIRYSVEVSVGVHGHVVVDYDVNVVYVYSSSEYIGCHHYSLLELLECSVSRQSNNFRRTPSMVPFFLIEVPVNGNGREIAVVQQLVQLHCSHHRLHENYHLVEDETVKEVAELPVLLLLLQLHEVLLKTVESQLGLVVNNDFEGLLCVESMGHT
jgi:hypothetical protein